LAETAQQIWRGWKKYVRVGIDRRISQKLSCTDKLCVCPLALADGIEVENRFIFNLLDLSNHLNQRI
jgi:hypothetical protein